MAWALAMPPLPHSSCAETCSGHCREMAEWRIQEREAAILAEREACAKLAEGPTPGLEIPIPDDNGGTKLLVFAPDDRWTSIQVMDTIDNVVRARIADAIRARSAP